MSKQRTHQVTTSDGVTIRGTVHGDGPPLVFLQGIIGDGDLDWTSVLPHVTDRFTCHLPSMRGRGLSSDHPDLRLGRLIDDFLVYVDSLGERTGLVGWSAGANWSLAVAAQSDAVAGVAPFEPVANSLMDERERAALGSAIARATELAGDGDLVAAMRAFAAYPFTDDEIELAEDAGFFTAAGRYVPNMLGVFERLMEHVGQLPDDPAVLGTISAPVVVLHGSATKPFFVTSAQHMAANVPNARVHEIRGAGHCAPLTHPQALAEALSMVFWPSVARPAVSAPSQQPA